MTKRASRQAGGGVTTFRLEIVGKLMKQIIGINVANIETQGMSFLFSRHIFSIAMSSGSVEGAANITLLPPKGR